MLQISTTKAYITRRQSVDQLLDKLPAMKGVELRKLWRNLFDREASPQLRRETLIPIIAYRIQEQAFGGLKESIVRKMREVAEGHSTGTKSGASLMLRPKVGTRYLREHQGKLHEVTVLEAGYEYEGSTFGSLTEIAKVITGTKWSGPAFFGLRHKTRKGAA